MSQMTTADRAGFQSASGMVIGSAAGWIGTMRIGPHRP
jgi:hypothetical protein